MKNFILFVFAVFNEANPIEELKAKMAGIAAKTEAILNKADSESRELTDAELAEINTNTDAFAKLESQLTARATVQNLGKSAGRKVSPGAPSVILDLNPEKGGFKNMGDFANSVRAAVSPGAKLDPRLIKNAPTSYGQEGVGEDGGFLVPDDFRMEIWEKVSAPDTLLGMCDNFPTSKSSIAVPMDSVAPWDNASGIKCYWDKEAAQLNQSKPALDLKRDSLHRLTALVPVSDELLEDAPMLGAYIARKAPEKMNFKVSSAIFAGTGAGEPLGILNAASTVSVAKESGQVADTVLFQNVVKMYSRLYAPCMKNAVWLINQDCLPQLMQMVTVSAAGLNMPAYLPPAGLSEAPYGTLMGRPVIFHEVCNTLGDLGDIVLVDLSKYLAATKAGGIKSDTSMHLYFDYNMQAFRFVFRVSGSPWWKEAITPRSGSANTLGSAVTLAARA
jgi:HK97 family phage major capsid protein